MSDDGDRVECSADTPRRRRQNRERAKKFRAREKKKKAAAMAVTRLPLAEEFANARCLEYASEENVRWLVQVGTAPSAACARSPIAGIVSNVSCRATTRWSVELYRWRLARFFFAKQTEIVLQCMEAMPMGLSLRFDETPARVFEEGAGATVVKAFVRCVCLYGMEGRLFEFLPAIHKAWDGKWDGLLGAMDLPSLHLGELAPQGSPWKFVLVVADGAATNRAVAKGIIAHCSRYPKMFVAFAVCFAHVLSNCTKWSVGRAFPFGAFVRVCHILQARPFRKADLYCRRIAESPYVPPDVCSGRDGSVVWSDFLDRFFAVGGPFSEGILSPEHECRKAKCIRLWPSGPPLCGGWRAEPGIPIADYEEAVKMLFARTINTPLLSRWYSLDSVAWFLLGVHSFGIFAHVLPPEVDSLRFWPGDDPSALLIDGESYKAQSANRLTRMRSFLQDGGFVGAVLRCAVSSIPRTAFARGLYPTKTGDGERHGVGRACDAMLRETLHILSGSLTMVEYFVEREADCARIRLSCYRALLASVAYVSMRNLPYTGALWRIIRGEAATSTLMGHFAEDHCCSDSGMERKIRASLLGIQGPRRTAMLLEIHKALLACGRAYCEKGGSTNLESETTFSHLRILALKTPYRPPKLATGAREVCLKVLRSRHKAWYDDYVARVFGSVRNMRMLLQSSAPRANGFTTFCSRMKVFGDVGKRMWSSVAEADRAKWARIAIEENARRGAERANALAAVSNAREAVPFGSRHKRIPVSWEEIYARLNDPSDGLASLWERDSIREFRRQCQAPRGPYVPSASEREHIRRALLPGDLCGACNGQRRARRSALVPVWESLLSAFETFDGEEYGVTCGLRIGDELTWFELVVVTKKPRALIAFPLEVLSGGNDAPLSGRAVLGGSFDGRSLCVLDYLSTRGNPTEVTILPKEGCRVDNDGWYLVFGSAVETVGLKCASAKAPKAPRARRAPARKSALTAADFERMFSSSGEGSVVGVRSSGGPVDEAESGSDAELAVASNQSGDDVESADLSDLEFAADSDREVVAAHRAVLAAEVLDVSSGAEPRMEEHQQNVLLNAVSRSLNRARYGVTVKLREGNVVVYWNASEKERCWEKYVGAVAQTRGMPGCIQLTASKSASLSRRSPDACVRRCLEWVAWHSLWIYGDQPSLGLPVYMKLPLLLPGAAASSSCEIESASDVEITGASEAVHLNSDDLEFLSSSISDTSSGTDIDAAASSFRV